MRRVEPAPTSAALARRLRSPSGSSWTSRTGTPARAERRSRRSRSTSRESGRERCRSGMISTGPAAVSRPTTTALPPAAATHQKFGQRMVQ